MSSWDEGPYTRSVPPSRLPYTPPNIQERIDGTNSGSVVNAIDVMNELGAKKQAIERLRIEILIADMRNQVREQAAPGQAVDIYIEGAEVTGLAPKADKAFTASGTRVETVSVPSRGDAMHQCLVSESTTGPAPATEKMSHTDGAGVTRYYDLTKGTRDWDREEKEARKALNQLWRQEPPPLANIHDQNQQLGTVP